MTKRGTIVFFLGSPGAGKTEISKALLSVIEDGFNLNKDILSEHITTRKPSLNLCFSTQYFASSKVDEDSLYGALLKLAAYSLRSGKPGSTAIIEGNFGKRLTIDMLKTYFGDLESYNFYLVHVVCNDIDVQFERVCKRNASKDTEIVVENETYNLQDLTSFKKYCAMRLQEELKCIQTMSNYMSVLQIDNSTNRSSTKELMSQAHCLKWLIERKRRIHKSSSLPSFKSPIYDPIKPEIQLPIPILELSKEQNIDNKFPMISPIRTNRISRFTFNHADF